MPQISPVSWPFAVFALVALPAMAQVNTPPAPPAPTTAQAVPVALPYPSAFEGYQSFTEEKVRPWKESNTTVEKVGGWRAYAKEVAEPEAKGGQTPAAPPAAAPRAPAAPCRSPRWPRQTLRPTPMTQKFRLLAVSAAALLLTGCATVDFEQFPERHPPSHTVFCAQHAGAAPDQRATPSRCAAQRATAGQATVHDRRRRAGIGQ
jgi:hypothetical protein